MKTWQRSRRKGPVAVVAVLGVAALVAWTAGPASADHLTGITAKCSYEVPEPQVSYTTQFAIDDPSGLTTDGAINKGICGFHTPDSDPGENANWVGPEHVVISGVTEISGQFSRVQASIVDDAFGAGPVGGLMCADFDHDHICGNEEDGEPLHRFCGSSPVVTVGQDSDGDGHPDFGWGLFVAVNDAYHQSIGCDPVAAPSSTTGGVLDPAGGIYVTVSG